MKNKELLKILTSLHTRYKKIYDEYNNNVECEKEMSDYDYGFQDGAIEYTWSFMVDLEELIKKKKE